MYKYIERPQLLCVGMSELYIFICILYVRTRILRKCEYESLYSFLTNNDCLFAGVFIRRKLWKIHSGLFIRTTLTGTNAHYTQNGII